MKITLVLCPSWGIETPHLGVALLAANLRKHGYQVQVCDFNIRIHNRDKEKGLWKSEEDVHWEDKKSLNRFIQNNDEALNSFVEEVLAKGSEVIGFSIYNTTKGISLELAKRIKGKDKSKIIICGGQMCFPKPAAESIIREPVVDAVVMGEGDEVIVNLMRKITESGKPGSCAGVFYKDNGDIIDCGMAPPIMDLDNLPYPDFSDFDLKLYDNSTQLPILSGRGCPYQCVFCNTKLFWIKYRSMSGDRIFQEVLYQLNKYDDVHFFTFNDHTVNVNMKALCRFVDLVIELKTKKGMERKNYAEMSWRGAAVIREEMDKDFINKLKSSGCIELEFGIESASNKVRKLMRKPPDDIKVVERVIKDTTEAGIGVRANFMFGFPRETEEDFHKTLEFLKRNKDYFVQVHPSETFCHIDPNTYMYNHPEEFGITNYKGNSLYWESVDGKNIYPERLRRHQIFCKLANSLNIPLSPGGHKILLHKQHFLDGYNRYLESLFRKEDTKEDVITLISKDSLSDSKLLKQTDETLNKKIRFHWCLHYKCNYSCPYCDYYRDRLRLNSFNKYFSAEEWAQAWHRIYFKYGECDMEISGGEPLLYPLFNRLAKELTKEHNLKIETNLSCDIRSLIDLIDDADLTKLYIAPRFHPLFAEFETFAEKVLFLKERGVSIKVSYVAYPAQLKQMSYFKGKFEKKGIDFVLLLFKGEYQGLSYPDDYSESEKNLIKASSELLKTEGKIWMENYPLSLKTKDGLCKAGQKYIHIDPDGMVYRCGECKIDNNLLGSFIDENFKLLDRPQPCVKEPCLCENELEIR